MKIKELHIRNIASIEKADIDFEQGLADAVTGVPSSIFLIAGDTGTGKTVILDAIAMALYKKTPRIVDVANKQNNDYTDTEGQTISINSIEQYTRLGISEKDPCYSELIFEGNDGSEYHARLELGIVKGNTDANGNRPMKHRAPRWTYKKGSEDWQRVDPKGQILINAVGLSFEQFGRMAMLAQGQFAAFLTGDKTERESILEQLTNTSKFTLYGKAITSLYNAAKVSRTNAQTTYDTEKEHTLSAEALQTLTDELSSLNKQKETLDAELRTESERLKVVDDIVALVQSREQTAGRKAGFEATLAGDDYRQKKSLINDWDATNQERQQLLGKQKAAQRMATAEAQLVVAHETFRCLSADLAYREARLSAKSEEHVRQRAWLLARVAHDELFMDAPTVALQLDHVVANTKKIDDTCQSLQQEKDQTLPLQTRAAECSAQEKQCRAAVDVKQKAIELLQNQRSALDMPVIRLEKDNAQKRKTALEKLHDRIMQLEDLRNAARQTEGEVAQDAASLTLLREAYDKAQTHYEQQLRDEESVRSLLATMQMSVDDTLTELRRKMQASHADTCPLCGQSVDPLHFTDDFSRILTPLQQREEEARRQLEAATQQRDKDKTEYDKAKGALDAKQKALLKATETIGREQQTVDSLAVALLLQADEALLPQIDVSMAQTKERIAQLDAQLKKAEDLQTEINRLTAEKSPLDLAAQQAMREGVVATNAVENNQKKIVELEQSLAMLSVELHSLTTALHARLASYCPTWQDDLLSAQQRLKHDATEYLATKQQAEKLQQEICNAESLLSALYSLSDTILQQTSWTLSADAKAFETTDIQGAWTRLYAQIEHLQTECQEAGKALSDAADALSLYYAFSGKTEPDLIALIAQEQSVADARQYVSRIDGEYKSCCDALDLASSQISDRLKALQVEALADVPARDSLQAHVVELTSQQIVLVGRIGGIEEKLRTNKVNEKLFAEARQKLDKATAVYEKWDRLNKCFGGTRFRTLVQTYILRPLLNNANIYLEKITDRYTLTCSEDNEQLSILVLDRYNKDQVRSVTVLSGGERFMISLALSLALSSLNRQDMNVNILFIDEGFGTLDETNLNSVMATLEKLQEIAGQTNRRVGIISHREELVDRIPVKINIRKKGEGRSIVEITKE